MDDSSSREREKLLEENILLLNEMEKIKLEFKQLQEKSAHMESILGISPRFLPSNVAKKKLDKACKVMSKALLRKSYSSLFAFQNVDELKRLHQDECDRLKGIIDSLTKID